MKKKLKLVRRPKRVIKLVPKKNPKRTTGKYA